jgi:hypothetical protein
VLHQAALSRHSLRTEHGIICPDCKQEVTHSCPSPHSLSTSSGLQLPLGRYYHQPLSTLPNLTGLPTHFTVPTAQGIIFNKPTTANSTFESSTTSGNPTAHFSHYRELVAAHLAPAPFESSMFISDLSPTPRSILSSPSGPASSYPPSCLSGPSNAVYGCFSQLGKRYPHCADLECEPDQKRARPNLLEESTNEQIRFNPSQWFAAPDLALPNSFPLATTPPAPETIMLPSVLESPAAISEDGNDTPRVESGADWSITYNTEVQREFDVSVVDLLEVGPSIGCLRLSKDGKYLAVGFNHSGTTNIYDVETGEKTRLVCDDFLFQNTVMLINFGR